jgi:hypothetical protein
MTPSTDTGGARNPFDPDYASGGGTDAPGRAPSRKAPLAPPFFANEPSRTEPQAEAPPPQEEWGAADAAFPWEEDQGADEMLLTDMVEAPEATPDFGFDAGEPDYGFDAPVDDYGSEASVQDYGSEASVQDYGFETSVGEFDFEAPVEDFGFDASVPESYETELAPPGNDIEALAARLEALAQDLRRAGAEGVARHAGGDDPLGAVLAAVIAGYLAGRHDARS